MTITKLDDPEAFLAGVMQQEREFLSAARFLRELFPEAASCRSRSCQESAWPCRQLPNGWRLHLIPMIFTIRLSVSKPIDEVTDCATDGWCYAKAKSADAVAAFIFWNGDDDPPGPWIKHVTTGRQGPGSPRWTGEPAAPAGADHAFSMVAAGDRMAATIDGEPVAGSDPELLAELERIDDG